MKWALEDIQPVKLSDARQRAQEAREKVEAGVDPILDRKVRRAVSEPTEGYSTFWQYAEGRIAKWQEGWKNDKHHQQWGNTIKQHGKVLLEMPIDQIETRHIVAVLQPIWTKKQETARRLRGRIETVLDAAKVDKLRSGDNPARWVGHLEHILPKQRKDTKGHHEAMPFTDVPAFITRLRGLRLESTSAMALEFTILTAVRSGETRGILRKEVDLEKRIWTIPKERTKPGRPHRVPLSDQAFEILEGLCNFNNNPDDFLFVSNRGNPLSNMAMAMCLRGLDANGYTVHGFRSSFRDWAGDETDHAREVAEAALGHIVGDKAEQAYRRGDALDRRRRLMQDWADYVTTKPQTAPPASP